MKASILSLVLLFCGAVKAQNVYPPPELKVVNTIEAYRESIAADSNNRLVEIRRFVPGIRLDIRYATKNNFTNRQVYPQAKAFVRLPVARALAEVQMSLKAKGLGLKIYDSYRPYAITVKFWEVASDKSFVADPAKGSKHNRGCAVDLTLIDLKTGKELQMPTSYDSFSPAAAADYPDLPAKVLENRQLLIGTMQKHGFRVIPNEWWHFDYNGWSNYPLMDVPFDRLQY